MKFVFFGGEPLAVPVLNKLKEANLLPSLIICNPDRPSGRGQELTSPPTKVWAESEGIPVFQPDNYKDGSAETKLKETDWDFFVVVAYNFILPEGILSIPEKGSLNLHPSLLPKLRGASPIRTAILENLPEEIGVTVMLLEQKMDAGPILDQIPLMLEPKDWPMTGSKLDSKLASIGGDLLAETIQGWAHDELSPQEQDEDLATYCSKLDKEKRFLKINPHKPPAGRAAKIFLHTIYAFDGMGDAYFTHEEKRIKIKKAELTDGGTLRILRVIPEGKKEIDFKDYLSTIK
jgi:methionyl-tRNA formyltransferase